MSKAEKHKMEATRALKVLATNTKAIHVYEKCGFKTEAKLRKENLINGEYMTIS